MSRLLNVGTAAGIASAFIAVGATAWGSWHDGASSTQNGQAQELCLGIDDTWAYAAVTPNCEIDDWNPAVCETTTRHSDFRVRIPYDEPGTSGVVVTWTVAGTEQLVDTSRLNMRRGRITEVQGDGCSKPTPRKPTPDEQPVTVSPSWSFTSAADGDVVLLNPNPYKVAVIHLPHAEESR